MKKSVIAVARSRTAADPPSGWLDLDQLASVEVTSEHTDFPIESAFASEPGSGWRAATPGQQVIRLVFAEPQSIQRIHLEFSETQVSRTQQFTLRWGTAPDSTLREIARQQWNFSPDGSNREVEDYSVALSGVALFELDLIPDISGGGAAASLAQWRLA